MPHPDRVDIFIPADCPDADKAAFVALVRSAGEVDARLPWRVNTAASLVLLYRGGTLAGTAAIKNPDPGYHAGRFAKAKADLPAADYPLELGWIVVHDHHKKQGLSRLLTEAALGQVGARGVYATTRGNNDAMLHILPDYGFQRVGVPFDYIQRPGEQIVLFVRPGPA